MVIAKTDNICNNLTRWRTPVLIHSCSSLLTSNHNTRLSKPRRSPQCQSVPQSSELWTSRQASGHLSGWPRQPPNTRPIDHINVNRSVHSWRSHRRVVAATAIITVLHWHTTDTRLCRRSHAFIAIPLCLSASVVYYHRQMIGDTQQIKKTKILQQRQQKQTKSKNNEICSPWQIRTRRMAIANGTCVNFCNQPKAQCLP